MQELPTSHLWNDAVDYPRALHPPESRPRSYPSSFPNDRGCRTYPVSIPVIAPYSGRTGAIKGRGVRGPRNRSGQCILRP